MIDVVILLALCVIFYGGFWCGKTFGTVKNMWQCAKDLVKGKL